MSRKQDIGHAPPLVFSRASIDRRCKQIVLEGVAECALLIAYSSGNEAHYGIGNHGSRNLAAGEHIVANGDFTGDKVLAYAVIHTLIVPAKYHKVLFHRQLIGNGLCKLLSVWRGEDNLVVVALGFQCRNAAVHRLYLHHHSSLAAKGVIIDLAVLVERVVAQIVHHNIHQPLILGTLQDGATKRRLKHLGHHGDYVNSHFVVHRKTPSTKKLARGHSTLPAGQAAMLPLLDFI